MMVVLGLGDLGLVLLDLGLLWLWWISFVPLHIRCAPGGVGGTGAWGGCFEVDWPKWSSERLEWSRGCRFEGI